MNFIYRSLGDPGAVFTLMCVLALVIGIIVGVVR